MGCLLCYGDARLARALPDYPNHECFEIIQTLSDLVVRDGNGHVKTVLKPGESSGDDRNIEPGEFTDVNTDFEFKVKSVEVSRADEIGGKYVESLTYLLKATDLHGRDIEFSTAVPSNDALAVDLDADVNFPTFPAGTILNFVNGTNPNVPGWFVGTGLIQTPASPDPTPAPRRSRLRCFASTSSRSRPPSDFWERASPRCWHSGDCATAIDN